MRIFGRPLHTEMSYLCALCQPLPLSFVDADDDYDDDYSNRTIVIWLLCYLLFIAVLLRIKSMMINS